jgi:hypothetical protein
MAEDVAREALASARSRLQELCSLFCDDIEAEAGAEFGAAVTELGHQLQERAGEAVGRAKLAALEELDVKLAELERRLVEEAATSASTKLRTMPSAVVVQSGTVERLNEEAQQAMEGPYESGLLEACYGELRLLQVGEVAATSAMTKASCKYGVEAAVRKCYWKRAKVVQDELHQQAIAANNRMLAEQIQRHRDEMRQRWKEHESRLKEARANRQRQVVVQRRSGGGSSCVLI